MNAQIDGLDPYSDSVLDQVQFAVYQKRSTIEALKVKALILAACDPEKAVQAAKDYLKAAVPVGEGSEERAEAKREADMAAISSMGPISMDQLRPVIHKPPKPL